MKTFSSAYAGSVAPGSLEFGESGPSGASFIPRHALSHLCIDPTLPCLPPPPLMLRAQPRLLALGFKLGTGLLHCCWEIPLKRLKSQWWGLIASQQSMGNSSCHFGAGGGGSALAVVSLREPSGSNGMVKNGACQEQGPAEESSMLSNSSLLHLHIHFYSPPSYFLEGRQGRSISKNVSYVG